MLLPGRLEGHSLQWKGFLHNQWVFGADRRCNYRAPGHQCSWTASVLRQSCKKMERIKGAWFALQGTDEFPGEHREVIGFRDPPAFILGPSCLWRCRQPRNRTQFWQKSDGATPKSWTGCNAPFLWVHHQKPAGSGNPATETTSPGKHSQRNERTSPRTYNQRNWRTRPGKHDQRNQRAGFGIIGDCSDSGWTRHTRYSRHRQWPGLDYLHPVMFCDSSLYCILTLIGGINLIDTCCMHLYEVH